MLSVHTKIRLWLCFLGLFYSKSSIVRTKRIQNLQCKPIGKMIKHWKWLKHTEESNTMPFNIHLVRWITGNELNWSQAQVGIAWIWFLSSTAINIIKNHNFDCIDNRSSFASILHSLPRQSIYIVYVSLHSHSNLGKSTGNETTTKMKSA